MGAVKWILILGFTGGLACLLYFALKLVLRQSFSMKSRCLCLAGILALFVVPAGALLPPLMPLPAVNISGIERTTNMADAAGGDLQEEVGADAVQPAQPTDMGQPDALGPAPDGGSGNSGGGWLSWNTVSFLWAVVFAALFGIKLVRYCRFCHMCRENSVPAGEELLQMAKQEQERFGVGRRLSFRVWRRSQGECPMVLGLFHPMILLPVHPSEQDENGMAEALAGRKEMAHFESLNSTEALRLAIDHELIHVRQHHLWLKMAGELVASVHWYHPLAYWLRTECGRVSERAVDEALAGAYSPEARQSYCLLLLQEASRQIDRRNGLVSGMGTEKRRLKERMQAIMGYKQASKKARALTAALLTAGIAVSLLAEGCVANQTGANAREQAQEAVYVGEDGLRLLNLQDGESVLLDSEGQIRAPKLSTKGSYAAYIKDDALYLVDTKGGTPEWVAKGEQDYCWYDDTSLLYSSQDYEAFDGIHRIHGNTRQSETYGDPKFMYADLTTDHEGRIFARKSQVVHGDEGTKVPPYGIISLSMESGEEETLVEAISYEDERYQLGASYAPQIEGISKDSRYLYIWDRTASGSMSADGMRVGIYDLKERIYMRMVEGSLVTGPITPEEPWDQYILQNSANLSASPLNPLLLAANLGAGREMTHDKQLGLLDFEEGTESILTDSKQATETVRFSLDGKSVYYASGQALTDEEQMLDGEEAQKLWHSREHSIYRMDLESGQTAQVTKGHFDLLPFEIKPGAILFLRYESGVYSLWQTDGTAETKLADMGTDDIGTPEQMMDIVYR